MVLAILQQTNATLVAQQAQMVALQLEFLNAQDSSASYAQLTKLYAAYLADALAANANLSSIVRSDILHFNGSSSLLPVSHGYTSRHSSTCHSYKLLLSEKRNTHGVVLDRQLVSVALCMLQDKISSSTTAVRTRLIAQRTAAQAALGTVSVSATCNRTAAMEFVFEVGVRHA